MPVSYLPCITPLLLVAIPLLYLRRGRKSFLRAAAISVAVFFLLVLWVYVPGLVLMIQAERGNPEAQYKLAQWFENHSEQLNSIMLWPIEPDVLRGFSLLEKAAAQDYPPALYLVGVRLKYGQLVPEIQDLDGPAGDVFPPSARGQKLIDRALQLGFRPPQGDEVSYYARVFRRRERRRLERE